MKLDKQRRLTIPACLLRSTNLLELSDPSEEIRLGIRKHHFLIFQNTPKNKDLEFSDVINFDSKGRVILKNSILKMAGIEDASSTEFIISALRDKIIVRW